MGIFHTVTSSRKDLYIGIVLSLAAFTVYLLTLAPSVTFIDSGELATVAATLGIAHPTGYPLFTLLGWAFVHLPLGGTVIWKLNLLSALLCSAAVFFFYRLFFILLSEKTLPGSMERIAAAVAALVLAFSETYWTQALSIEVYPLHLLLLSLVLLLFMRSMVEKGSHRSWYLFALVLGLSFTNHMTTILLAPGFLFLYFKTHGFSRAAWIKIARAIPPFLLGLSVYLYLPFRASQNPWMNWGNPVTWERFLGHVSGRQFRVWMFSSFDAAGKQFAHFVSTFPSEFGYAPLLFALVGLVYLFRRSRKLLIFTLLLFFGCVFYSINYDIHDIDSYFLLAYLATGIWVAYGIRAVLESAKGKVWRAAAWTMCGALFVPPMLLHYRNVDQSRNYAVEDYAKNMLGSLDSGAVILSSQWDYFVSASYYFQRVARVRPDVTVIDKELLRRSWYYSQLERQHPRLIADSRAEVDALLPELNKFEHDLLYDPAVIEARYHGVIRSFIAKSVESRPVYVTSEIGQEYTAGFERVPSGLAFRLFRDSVPAGIPTQEFAFHPFPEFPKGNFYVDGIKTQYASAYVNQGVYRAVKGDRLTAVRFIRKALEVVPSFQPAMVWLNRLGEGR